MLHGIPTINFGAKKCQVSWGFHSVLRTWRGICNIWKLEPLIWHDVFNIYGLKIQIKSKLFDFETKYWQNCQNFIMFSLSRCFPDFVQIFAAFGSSKKKSNRMVFSDGMFSMIFSAWYFQPGLCSYESETKFVVAVAVAAGRMPLGASIWVAGLHRSPSHRAAWPTGPFRFYVALPSLVHGYCWKHLRWIRSFTSSAENVHIFDAYCILWNNDKFYGLIRPILCMLDVATIEATAWEKKLKGGIVTDWNLECRGGSGSLGLKNAGRGPKS